MTINALYNKVKSLDTDKVAVDSVTSTVDDYKELNKDQMSKGFNSQGDIIGVYANRQYAVFKKAIGGQAPFGIVDLKLTGDFAKQIKTSVTGQSIITDSSDSKSGDLQGKYGSVIFGLSTSYKVEYVKILRPVFFRKIKDALKL